jgi:hypothetical protein
LLLESYILKQFADIFRLLIDVQSLNDRIGGVNGAGDIGAYLLKLVNDKTVLRPPSPVPARASLDANSTITNGAESLDSLKSAQKEPEIRSGSLEKEDAPPAETTAKPETQSSEKS